VSNMPTQKSIVKARYDAKSTKHFSLKYNLKTDADVIAQLEKQDSVQGYIKSLIRKDIAEQEGAKDNV